MSNLRLLKPYQKTALAFVRARNLKAGLFMAPGTGKTVVAIRAVPQLNPPEPFQALILCRRDDFLTWETELGLEGAFPDEILRLESPDDLDLLPTCRWVLCTYDRMRNESYARAISQTPFLCVIADEAHSIKRWQARRTKATYKHTRHIPYRLALTGTAITNDPIDLWALTYFLDDGRTFGDSPFAFLARYYVKPPPPHHGHFLRRGAKDLIAQRLRTLAFSVHEDDPGVLELPPIRRVVKAVPPSFAQRRLYNQVLEEWEIALADPDAPPLEISHVIVQVAKLKQIASGFFYDDQHHTHLLPCTKMDLLRTILLDDLARTPKIVIWCSHTAEIERIAATLPGTQTETFYGRLTLEQRQGARTRFFSNPHVRFFIAQVDAGVGMNELVVADTAVYFSNSRRVVSRQQSMRRTRRIGSEHHRSITYYDLLTEKTIDVHIHRSIGKSMDLAQEILNALTRGRPLKTLLPPA